MKTMNAVIALVLGLSFSVVFGLLRFAVHWILDTVRMRLADREFHEMMVRCYGEDYIR